MRAPILLLLFGALAVARPAAADVEYKPPGAGFKVEFPGRPAVRTESINTSFGPALVVTAEWTRSDGGKCYAVHTRHVSGGPGEDPQRTFDRLRIGRTVKGILRSEQRFLMEDNPAQRQIVEWTGQTRPVIVALDVVRGPHLYSIFCIVDRGQDSAPDVLKFVASFALLPL